MPRIEKDSLGPVEVPDDALYGAQTQRAVDNFRISPRRMPETFIRTLALIKTAAARANLEAGVLSREEADAIEAAARAIAAGEHGEHFPVPVFQTGSGTSTNMNMNEVIARLARNRSGLALHPNDDVNASQSSNDVIPSCLQVTALVQLRTELRPAIDALLECLGAKAESLRDVVKTGRTHLMDAMPLTVEQEMGAWHYQVAECAERLREMEPRLARLPLGGSAVGTGVNVPESFAACAVRELSALTGQDLARAASPFARIAGQEVSLEFSAQLRSLAVALTKIANDLRWMGSGPLCGLGEIELEALQPGSSIMPGKVNPVLPEAVLMACAEIQGNDAAISLGAQSGAFQLNVMLPLIADKLLAGIGLASGACAALARTIEGFSVNRRRIEERLAANPMLATALNGAIGYERAAQIAKRSFREGRAVIDVAVEDTDLSREELQALLDPRRLAQPPA